MRVPTFNVHSEAVWVTLEKEAHEEDVLLTLTEAAGLVVQNNWRESQYPMICTATGRDPVFVGRIHRDSNDSKTWMLWVVADNIRKGAALNGIQIAEKLIAR